MENHLPHQTQILSMNISCCEGCPKKLKKKLLKMPGVDTVAIDTENHLIVVTGTIDPTTLVKNVAKFGKRVQLLPPDKLPPNNVKEKHNNFAAGQEVNMHKNCCCQDGRHNKKKEIEDEEHKCEAYVPPKVSERTCRDFYCNTHATRKIADKVPEEKSNLYGMGGLPFYGSFGPHSGGLYLYPGWYGEEPSQFGYGLQPRMLPQHPFSHGHISSSSGIPDAYFPPKRRF